MYLFFDTETTGLSRTSDHVVQVAWILADEDGNVECEECRVIRPEGYSIPWAAAKIHGITTAIAEDIGDPLSEVLNSLSRDVRRASAIVAHNLNFDLGILQGDFKNAGMPFPFHGKTQICTMKLSTTWCRLPKLNQSSGFKWPKLEELHYRLFGRVFDDAHNALSDARACMQCYFDLVRMGVISPPKFTESPAPSISSRPKNIGLTVSSENELDVDVTKLKEELLAKNRQIADLDNQVAVLKGQAGTSMSSSQREDVLQVAKITHQLNGESDFPSWLAVYRCAELEKLGYKFHMHGERPFVIFPDGRNAVIQTSFDIDDLLDNHFPSFMAERKLAYLSESAEVNDRISVASNIKCPPEILISLSRDEDPEVLDTLANNPACSLEIFETLLSLDDETIVAVIAANRGCPASVLGRIAESRAGDDEIIERIAANENATSALLAELCYCYPSTTISGLAKVNPSFRENACRELISKNLTEDPCEEIRCITAELDCCPVDILASLAKDVSRNVRKAVASNQFCDVGVLIELARNDDHHSVRQAALANPVCPLSRAGDEETSPEVLDELSLSPHASVRLAVASNKSCPQYLLETLRRDSDPIVRLSAVSHGTLSPGELGFFSADSYPPIRKDIVKRENISREILERASKDLTVSVRLAVARHPRVAQSALTRLADDQDVNIRKAVANHIGTPDTELVKLANDPVGDVRMAVARRPKLSEALLYVFSKSQFFEYRREVALNPSCPAALLERLATDPAHQVSEVARRRLTHSGANYSDRNRGLKK